MSKAPWHLFLSLLASASLMSPCLAVTLGQVDDFQDGTAQNWGTPGNTVTTNLADAGPVGVGDNALNVVMAARSVIFNENQQWSGDWVVANIQQIALDVKSLGNQDLTLWLGISKGSPFGGGGGDTYVTNSSQPVPGDGQWHSISFSVTETDFTNFGGSDVEKALKDITQFRIIHNPNQNFVGAFGVTGFQLDNIATVPEPSGFVLAILGLMAWVYTGSISSSRTGRFS
ncbi:MAG: hypothetical protein ABGX16_08015 [Pirellulales bacterium]